MDAAARVPHDGTRAARRSLPPRAPQAARMDYREFPPPPSLAPFVETLWTLRDPVASDARERETIVPDGCLELIAHLGDPFARVGERGVERVQASRLLAGQFERHIVLRPGRVVDVLGVRFQPHGSAPFLACAPAELTGRIAPLDEVDPELGAAVARALARAGAGDDARRAALSDVLVARLARRRAREGDAATDALVADAVRRLVAAGGCLAIDALAQTLGVSARHLTRRFTAVVGVGPKVLARTLRFQQVFRAFREGGGWARVAVDCGFSDQSHLVREFRRFAGEPPAAFLQGLNDVTAAFLRRERERGDDASEISKTHHRRRG